MASKLLVVLDANVLYSAVLRDHMLWLAEQGLYHPLWTEEIVQEMRRAILHNRPDIQEARVDHLVEQMRRAFDEAWIDDGYKELVDAMPNDPGDHHVLAAAVHAEASAIVTNNTRDFPADVCATYGVQVFRPDTFLCQLLQENPEGIRRALEAQSQALRNPPLTPLEILQRLERYAPTYAQAIRADLARPA